MIRVNLISEGLLTVAEHAVTSQGMLQNTLLKDASKLDGMSAQALNRIYNQVRDRPLLRKIPLCSKTILPCTSLLCMLRCCLQRMRVLPAAVQATQGGCQPCGRWLKPVICSPDSDRVAVMRPRLLR